MLKLIVSAFIMGFLVSIPPGAVTMAGSQLALKRGFLKALFFGMGSTVSDIFYLVLVFFGVAELISGSSVLKIILWIFSGGLLCFWGISAFVKELKKKGEEESSSAKEPTGRFLFFSGIGITLVNPVTVIGWIGIGGHYFLTLNQSGAIPGYRGLLLIPIIIAGCFSWYLLIMFLVSRMGHLVGGFVLKILIMVSSLALAVFGIWGFVSAIREAFLFFS